MTLLVKNSARKLTNSHADPIWVVQVVQVVQMVQVVQGVKVA